MENLGNGQQQRKSLFRLSKLALAIYTVGIGSIALPLHSAYAATTNAKSYNISLCTRQISQNPYPIRILPS
ncbi:hypothetical protein GPS60_13680 [Acinetobacter haemolyticus]|nr:hypothetical protein [Acinetobacter haemolyticus]